MLTVPRQLRRFFIKLFARKRLTDFGKVERLAFAVAVYRQSEGVAIDKAAAPELPSKHLDLLGVWVTLRTYSADQRFRFQALPDQPDETQTVSKLLLEEKTTCVQGQSSRPLGVVKARAILPSASKSPKARCPYAG